MGRAGSKDPNRRNGTQVLILEFVGLFLDPLRIQNLCAGSGSSRPGSYDVGGTGSRRPIYHHPGHTGALRRYGERDPRGLRALRFLVILEVWIPLGALGAGVLGAHVHERDRTLPQ